MARSLWVKLMGAFALVILVGTGLVVVLVSQATQGQFELYVTQSGRQWALWLAPTLADFYARSGAWGGVEAVLQNPWASTTPGGMSDGMMDGGMNGMDEWGSDRDMMPVGNGWLASGSRLVLADAAAQVVADTAGTLNGAKLQPDDIARGVPIVSGGRTVGTLIVTPDSQPATPAAEYLAAVNRSVVWAGLAAGVVALVLGSFLFFQIIRPLRSLSAAAHGIAQGDLSQRAWVGSQDDVGQVALTFNHMADALQRFSAERRQLFADVAHELRTPLAVIQSNLEAMLDGVLPASPEELASLHLETRLLNRVISDLRTLTLAEAGQLRLEKQWVVPGLVLQQVVERLRLRAEEKAITLETHLAEGVPQILADPQRLTQIITNLVDNALRYTPAGTRITLAARPGPGALELTVEDDGPGIPPAELPHVFDRFWRAEKSRNRATGGSGLGLAIVKHLVEAHGGQIHVSSWSGQGTHFCILLPTDDGRSLARSAG